ncbi:MAG: monovalent cation/H+ antiporter complex subunit F [Candidatus Omnitrophota bacterium]
MNKRLAWFLGMTGIVAAAALILLMPVSSMVGWQSPFLARAFSWLLFLSLLCLWRILRGPTAPDRAVAVDMFGILIVGFCAILCIATGRDWYIDIAIAWSLQSFIGIMALAKYLEGKDFDE